MISSGVELSFCVLSLLLTLDVIPCLQLSSEESDKKDFSSILLAAIQQSNRLTQLVNSSLSADTPGAAGKHLFRAPPPPPPPPDASDSAITSECARRRHVTSPRGVASLHVTA